MTSLARKRILLLDTGKEWGGGTNSMLELLTGMNRQEFAVTCVFYHDYTQGAGGCRLSERLSALGVPMVLISQPRQPFWAKLVKESIRGLLTPWPTQRRNTVRRIDYLWRIRHNVEHLCRLWRTTPFDLLYMNNQPSSNLEGYLAAERLGVPVVQHARIDVQLTYFEVATVNRLASRVICNSNGVRLSLVGQGVQEQRCVTVHNGFDANRQIPDNVVPLAGWPVLGTIGSLVPRKCFEHLITLGAKLKKRYPHLVVLIVGEGPQKSELIRLAEQQGMRNSVTFAGFQSEIYPWLKAMDIFVFPSRQEGFGKVLLEAMFAAVPVVAADVIGPNEVVVNGETGLLYPHGDIDVMEKCCLGLLEDRSIREGIVDRARESISTRFSLERYTASIERVFGEVLTQEGRQ